MNQTQLRELKRLQSLYPLFKFKPNELQIIGRDSKTLYVDVMLTRSSSISIEFNEYRLLEPHDVERKLDNEHMKQSMINEFMKQYPDLYIGLYESREGIYLSAWVKQENRDGSAITSPGIQITSQQLHFQLSKWQDEAHKSNEPNMFYCSGHNRAESKSEYGYFCFAGTYCKQFGIENPEHLKMAGRETYN